MALPFLAHGESGLVICNRFAEPRLSIASPTKDIMRAQLSFWERWKRAWPETFVPEKIEGLMLSYCMERSGNSALRRGQPLQGLGGGASKVFVQQRMEEKNDINTGAGNIGKYGTRL